MNKQTIEMLARLQSAGFSVDDAMALRRISMTLHRWHEGECGDSNGWASFCITRGYRSLAASAAPSGFIHDDAREPYLELHANSGAPVRYERIPDRERGAQKRLKAIMARYPGFTAYVQGDPRGCALYILRPDDLKPGDDVSSVYTRGIAVYK